MPPDAFTFDTSGQLVMQTAIGGAGHCSVHWSAPPIWLYLSDFFQNTLHLGSTWKLVLGVVFVLLVVFLRHGVIGGVKDLIALRVRASKPVEAPESDPDAWRLRPNRCDPRRAENARRADANRRNHPRNAAVDAPLWRPVRQSRHRFLAAAWRTARRHRPERRRQEHVLQDADVRSAANLRTDRVRRSRHHRLGRAPRQPARSDARAIRSTSCSTASPCARTSRSPRSRKPADPSAPTCCATRRRVPGLQEQVEETLALVNLTSARRLARLRTRLRRKAAAGDRLGACDQTEPAPAR